jgi:hypothetical protein
MSIAVSQVIIWQKYADMLQEVSCRLVIKNLSKQYVKANMPEGRSLGTCLADSL